MEFELRRRYFTESGARGRRPAHPTTWTYVKVAALLALVTVVEFGIIYVGEAGSVVIPFLIVLSAWKFALVAMFYMHLRFDARLFSGLFAGGLGLAAAVVLALFALFALPA